MTPKQRQIIIDEVKKGIKCTEIAAMIDEKAETVQRFVRARGLLPEKGKNALRVTKGWMD